MEDQKLEKLKKLIAEHDIGYYLVLSQDTHNCEYVSPCDKRREFLTGFTGSAGTAVVGRDGYAELATDGRYWLQAESQLGSQWVLRKEGNPGVVTWIEAISARAKADNMAIGVDPRLISYQQAKHIMGSGAELKAIQPNLIDKIWDNRPKEPSNPVFTLSTTYSGRSRQSKIADLREQLHKAKADAIVLSALDEIAWMLNLRGSDIDYNPVFKSYLVVTKDEIVLYISADHQLPPREELEDITLKAYNDVFDDIKALSFTMQKCVWVPGSSSWAMVNAAGVRALITRESPVEAAKAVKNIVEVKNADKAQLYCGISVLRLLSWLDLQISSDNKVDEYEASQKLQSFREELPEFRGPSFETISSSGPNAAIIHYAPSPTNSRQISGSEVYLVDSGSQFTFGTTDTTRTAWFGKNSPPNEVKEAYTLVLKGHIAMATAVFPAGSSGGKLDPLARQPMNKYGYNYSHGTGHGVGSFLNVHEGPIYVGSDISRSSTPLEIGNILSNEPGIYKNGKFGIRIESLMVVERAKPKHQSDIEFFKFRNITLVPLDKKLIDTKLLTNEEVEWINEYHAHCAEQLGPHVSGHDLEYLKYHTSFLQI